MIDIISHNIFHEIPDTHRACLPYGMDLLDLARWLNLHPSVDNRFEIISGSAKYCWHGKDAVSLYMEIRSKCLNQNFSDSILRHPASEALYFFDRHERFSFFTAPNEELDLLFPFDREVMWENFALLQEEDDEFSLREIFDTIHTK